jgi:hypothetical protein
MSNTIAGPVTAAVSDAEAGAAGAAGAGALAGAAATGSAFLPQPTSTTDKARARAAILNDVGSWCVMVELSKKVLNKTQYLGVYTAGINHALIKLVLPSRVILIS